MLPSSKSRENAPESIRVTIVNSACRILSPGTVRQIACETLRKRPDPQNWSEYPNVFDEVERLVIECDARKVYKIIEAMMAFLSETNPDGALEFEGDINECFADEQIPLLLKDGVVVDAPQIPQSASGDSVTDDIHADDECYPRVFISYTHDSQKHRERVLNLSDHLINDGLDCHIDRYYETPSPREGWPLWMERQIEQADFVLVVCTETYLRRFRRKEAAGQGLGAQWEGAAITQSLYNTAANNAKFIPVGFAAYTQNRPSVPLLLQATNYYDVATEDGYERLYRHLTGQPEVQRPPIGQRRVLPSRQPADFSLGGAGIGTGAVEAEMSPPIRTVTATTSSSSSRRPVSPNFTPAQLRQRMTERLNRADIGVLWFDLFGTTLDNDLPGRSLPECVVELLARVHQRGKMKRLTHELFRSYSHVLTPVAPD